ncbi:MCE family protein [Pseudonocardia eucalypti]|uniref:MCE family protein n=1 Tax=Pseudonocardia eucalypti TaxID=648755 RepID=A0ABP9QJP2_9PSEU|nr:phospholipid/cholesterol/gamma-HCH transport system substrate-binding protein [Pseudonocardia eucalypti]
MRYTGESTASLARIGVLGAVALVGLAFLVLSWPRVTDLFGGRQFTAAFAEAGGISPGDPVVVSGVEVGRVTGVGLADDDVDVRFQVSDESVRLGDRTGAAIKAKTALGRNVLALSSAGVGSLADGAIIPTERTTPAYDITEALSHLTRDLTAVDTGEMAVSFGALSEVLDSSAPQLRPALDGMTRLSQVINDRDTQLSELLEHTAGVTAVLAARDGQLRALIADGEALFTELNQRRDDLGELLRSTTELADQLRGLVVDNRAQLGPALDEVNHLLDTLRTNKANIDKILTEAPTTVRQVGEFDSAFPGWSFNAPNVSPPTSFLPLLPSLMSGGTR